MMTEDREAAAAKAAGQVESRYWALPTYPMMPFAGVQPGVTVASELQNRHQPEPDPPPAQDPPPPADPPQPTRRRRDTIWR